MTNVIISNNLQRLHLVCARVVIHQRGHPLAYPCDGTSHTMWLAAALSWDFLCLSCLWHPQHHWSGSNRFPCTETWAERSLGAPHLLMMLSAMNCRLMGVLCMLMNERSHIAPANLILTICHL